MTTILVVDDNGSLRRNVRLLLQCNSCEVCGEAERCVEAIAKVADLKLDVVILDASFRHGMDGLEAAREIRHIAPRSHTLFRKRVRMGMPPKHKVEANWWKK